jgi:hypothetical protein
MLTLDDGETVTVKECLRDPGRYHGRYCRDPIVPREDQPQVGWLRLQGGAPAIFAHKSNPWYRLQVAKAVMTLTAANINDVTDAVARVLAASGKVWQRDGQIVTVSGDGTITAQQGEALLHEIDERCSFQTYKSTGRGENRTTTPYLRGCPEQVGKRLTAMAANRQVELPKLVGVARNPVLLPSGAVVEEVGYHAPSGVLLWNTGAPWQPLARNPDAREIAAAFRTLWEPFQYFPFVDAPARSVALAAALTMVVRPSLGVTPGFLFSAPQAGTGKSYLAETLGEIAGRYEIAKPGSGRIEFDKTITAVLMRGAGCYVLDNLAGEIGTETFDALITSPETGTRVLGKSEMLMGHRCVWIMTANNGRLRGDTNRRVLTCRLDARTEQVLQRTFPFDPRVKARENRQAMVHAALTLMIGWTRSDAYNVAYGSGTGTGGAFADWARLVAGAVGWIGSVVADGAGYKDADGEPLRFVNPAGMLQEQLLEDDDRSAWGTFLAAWQALAAKEADCAVMTSHQVAEILEDYGRAQHTGSSRSDARSFFAATLMGTVDRQLAGARMVGKLFAQQAEVRVGGLKLARSKQRATGSESGNNRWMVQTV